LANGKAHELLEKLTRGETPRPLIIAHRGLAGRFPENTLAAFRAGLKTGAEVIELDYHHSSDGVPVVIHDATLQRTTNADLLWGSERLEVASRSAKELIQLDPAAKCERFIEGERLPMLSEALVLIQASSVTMIERKSGDAETLVRLLKELDYESDVVVQAFDWDFLRDCRRRSSEMVLGALCNKELTSDRVREASEIGVQIITWKQEILDRRGIELIHSTGKQAWAYTINEVARAKELINAGLDGLISNFPDEMLNLRGA
jgi:glycerophosphoryl diester phosphodiesterase